MQCRAVPRRFAAYEALNVWCQHHPHILTQKMSPPRTPRLSSRIVVDELCRISRSMSNIESSTQTYSRRTQHSFEQMYYGSVLQIDAPHRSRFELEARHARPIRRQLSVRPSKSTDAGGWD